MERNHKEDQANEMEALESIYCDDIEGISEMFPSSNFYVCRWAHEMTDHFYLLMFRNSAGNRSI